MSIILASRNEGGTLRSIVAYGDAVNHAIFRIEEVESGLYRLSKGGWITEKGEKFEPTQKTLIEYNKLNPKVSLYDAVDYLRSLLHVSNENDTEVIPNPKNIFHYPGFTKEKFDIACNEYITKKRPSK